jgi:hypothetical protein
VWRIVKELKQPLHSSISSLSVAEYPYTISLIIRKRMQIDSFLDLPKDDQPPHEIWDKAEELEEWFSRLYGKDKKQTEFTLPVDEVE